MKTGRNMLKVVLFYILLAALVTAVVAVAMQQETKIATISGEYKSGNYTLYISRNNLMLFRNANVVMDTAYKVAVKSGLTRLLPEKTWFEDGSRYKIDLVEKDGTVYMETTADGEGSLYYLLVKTEGGY